MEWKLSETRNAEYVSLINSAREIEANIGSHVYRGQKLIEMRQNVDLTLRTWWEEIIKELGVDPSADYMIEPDGTIKAVPRKGSYFTPPAEPEINKPLESRIGSNANELK